METGLQEWKPEGPIVPPQPQNQPPLPAPRGINSCVIIALIVAALLIGIAAVVVIGGGDRLLRAMEILRGEPAVVTVQVSPGEILPVLKLVVAEMNTTVHTSRTGPTIGGLQSVPRHIIAQGTVTACFDLENNAEQLDTIIDPNNPKRVTVRLPAPEYCNSGIDNAQFFDELGIGLPAGNEVNGKLLEDAQVQLLTAADSQDLLGLAKERGSEQVQLMLYKLGFETVEVEFRAPEHVE
jgi:hypothetical protein